MLTAKIKQKLKDAAVVTAPKRQAPPPPAPHKPKKITTSTMPVKPVVLGKRTSKPPVAPPPRPTPRPVEPKPKRMITTMPIPQAQIVETLPPPPPPMVTAQPPAPVLEPVKVVKSSLLEPVMPKVDTEPVVLGSYFSVQILRGESYRDVANAVLTAAAAQGVLFRKLQVMDIMAVGTTAFVRFRSDVQELDKVLQELPTRGRVAADATGSYVVSFQDGRKGKYPTSTMNSSPKLGFGQTFAGTRIARWKQQFA